MPEPCGVVLCVAEADGDDGFCRVHRGAKLVKHVLAGVKCIECQRAIEQGQWVTRASTATEMTHAVCPPPREFLGRKKDRWKPLLDSEA